MLFSKAMVAASFFMMVVFSGVSAMPQPGVIRERHIIHAPIKYKIIHHYNIKKVPVFIKKHLHYYKPQEEIHHHQSKPALDETQNNQIYQDGEAHLSQYHHPQLSFPQGKEEDYDEAEQSQEENDEYEDYEYE